MSGRQIIVRPHHAGFQAHEVGIPGTWEYGRTPEEAASKLCHTLWLAEGHQIIWPVERPADSLGEV